jgi:hypothetical protein
MDNYFNARVAGNGKHKIGEETTIHHDCPVTSKPAKYYLQDFKKGDTEEHPFTRGVNWRSFFAPSSDVIGDSSKLRHGCITNMGNVSTQLGALPLPTTPGMIYGQGNVDIESSIRPGLDNRTEGPCQPRDNGNFYERSFAIFEGMPIKPNACADNYVEQHHAFRQGVSTRKTQHYKK